MARFQPNPALTVDGPEADRIMEILEHRPKVSAKYLADQLDRDHATIKRLLVKMETAGMVVSEVSPVNALGSTWASTQNAAVRPRPVRKAHTVLSWSPA